MVVKDFDKLTKRDFENGAVLDEIRRSLVDLEELRKYCFTYTEVENVFYEAIDIARREKQQ